MRRRRMRAWRVVLVTSIAWLVIVGAFFIYHISTGCSLHGSRWDSVDEPVVHYGSLDHEDVDDGSKPQKTSAAAKDRTKQSTSRKTEATVRRDSTPRTYPPWKLYKWSSPPVVPKKDRPGEMGQGINLEKSMHSIMNSRFKQHQFNIMVSDVISVNRSLPDFRAEECLTKSKPDRLPDTSVILVFHKEARSTLLRTIHSVINRSPRALVKEIILVDDASFEEHLGKELEAYVAKLPVPVHILRMPKRSGLIRARLFGAKFAKGSVLTFLDAHCECSEGWLEPLLMEIARDRRTVVTPVIDVISDKNFQYTKTDSHVWGGFNWKLSFRWFDVPERELQRRGSDKSEPLRSPAMAGGLFSMDRDYFYEIGSYDTGMEIWGAENIEMSLRIWQCGGVLLIVPCSHVGHVFRDNSPYTFPGGGAGKVVPRNTIRVARVWLDDWVDFYTKMAPESRTIDAGDVSERVALRKKLQCKSFQWYLDTIFPESPMAVGYYTVGELRNTQTQLCLDTMGRESGSRAGIGPCHGLGGNQLFVHTKRDEIVSNELCLDATGSPDGRVTLITCHHQRGNQAWFYNNETARIKHKSSGKCLSIAPELTWPVIADCNTDASNQDWMFVSNEK